MLNKQDFKKLREEMAKFDEERENLIKKARDLLKSSKQIIYSIHRGDLKETALLLNKAKKEKNELDSIASRHPKLFYEGSYSEANQEYVEAMCYLGFINGKLPSKNELKVDVEDYLSGICDLTGELTRRAVSSATKNDFEQVERIKSLVEDIHGEFLKINLRNSLLRKKSDSINWNLKKLEDVMYDIKLRK